MLDDITEIINSNEKVEQLVRLENEISKLKQKIRKIDQIKDKEEYDRAMCEKAVKEMNLKYAKGRLDEDSIKAYENIRIFFEYNELTEKIKKIEKRSKKSNNVVLTENSEGRKKEIDSNLIDYYNVCVDNKKKISKDFVKAIGFISTYKENDLKKEKVLEQNIEEPKTEEKVNYVNIADIKYKKEEPEELKLPEEKPKNTISFINKIKRYAAVSVIGFTALASAISFGNAKDNKDTKKEISIENDADTENEMKSIEEVNIEHQMDEILADNIVDQIDEIEENEIDDENLEVIVETKKPTLNDNLKVLDSSKIMCDQYAATYYENGKNPYYDSNQTRTVEGVVYQFSDGSIKTARSEDEVSYFESIGGNITAYLTYSEYGVEGFYSIQDVVLEDCAKTLTKKL